MGGPRKAKLGEGEGQWSTVKTRDGGLNNRIQKATTMFGYCATSAADENKLLLDDMEVFHRDLPWRIASNMKVFLDPQTPNKGADEDQRKENINELKKIWNANKALYHKTRLQDAADREKGQKGTTNAFNRTDEKLRSSERWQHFFAERQHHWSKSNTS